MSLTAMLVSVVLTVPTLSEARTTGERYPSVSARLATGPTRLDDAECGTCETWANHDPYHIYEDYFAHWFGGVQFEAVAGPLDAQAGFDKTLSSLEQSIFGGPSDGALSIFATPPYFDWWYMGAVRSKCVPGDYGGCHTDDNYGTCGEHAACTMESLNEEEILADLLQKPLDAAELKLRILLETRKLSSRKTTCNS